MLLFTPIWKFTQHHLLTKILYLTLLLNKYFSIFFLEMNSTKYSKDNKRKDTELTEEQSTEKQTEKCVRLSNTNATVEGILFFLLKEK